MEKEDMRMQCLHLAANMLGANNAAALVQDSKPLPTAEEVVKAAETLFTWANK